MATWSGAGGQGRYREARLSGKVNVRTASGVLSLLSILASISLASTSQPLKLVLTFTTHRYSTRGICYDPYRQSGWDEAVATCKALGYPEPPLGQSSGS